MNIEDFKQLHDLIGQEINVKEVVTDVGQSELGRVTLVYKLADRTYYWRLIDENNQTVRENSVVSTDAVCKLLTGIMIK